MRSSSLVSATLSGLLAKPTVSAPLLRAWLHRQRTGRPLVIAKIATTLDGRVAAPDGTSQWITGAQARADAHVVRGGLDAIVVGTGTEYRRLRAIAANGLSLIVPLRQAEKPRVESPGDFEATDVSELMAWEHKGFWQPMDTLRDKRHLEELWQSGRAPWKVWATEEA